MKRLRPIKTNHFFIVLLLSGFILNMALTADGSAKPLNIRFAFQDRIGSVLPIIAYEKGFFKDQGLEIKALRFSSGPASAEALYSGSADIAAMGDTTAIIMMTRSDKFTIMASHATGEHRHRIMVGKDSTLQALNDLEGRRVAVKKGTSTYGGLLAALTGSGISPGSIRLMDLTPPTMVDALLAGSIDAFAASEPTPSLAEQKGAVELASLGGLGNQYPIMILGNREWLGRKKTEMEKFVKAMKRAEDFISQYPKETARIMSVQTGLSAATAQKVIKRHQYGLRLDRPILDSLHQTARFLKEERIIDRLPDFSTIVKMDFHDIQ